MRILYNFHEIFIKLLFRRFVFYFLHTFCCINILSVFGKYQNVIIFKISAVLLRSLYKTNFMVYGICNYAYIILICNFTTEINIYQTVCSKLFVNIYLLNSRCI